MENEDNELERASSSLSNVDLNVEELSIEDPGEESPGENHAEVSDEEKDDTNLEPSSSDLIDEGKTDREDVHDEYENDVDVSQFNPDSNGNFQPNSSFDRTHSVPNFSGMHSLHKVDRIEMHQKTLDITNQIAESNPNSETSGNAQTPTPAGTSTAASVSGHVNKIQLPWDRMHQWIYCIAVVTFDVELGQTIEHIYPPHISLEQKERSNVCFLSFPDSNSGCMGDTVYSFRIRHSSRSTNRLNNLQKHHFNVYSVNKYQGFQDYLYGAVHFRQMRDTSIKRGYFQKSVVVLSSLPFISLWLEVVRVVGDDFFLNGEVSLEVACHCLDQWSHPLPGSQLQLPLMGNVFEVTLPHQGQMSVHVSKNGFSQLRDGTTQGRRYRGDARISRVLGSVVDLDLYACFQTLLPHMQLIWELVLLGQPIVVMGSSPDITSRMVYILTSIIYPFKWGSDYRPYFTIHDSEFKEFTHAPSANSSSSNSSSNSGRAANTVPLSSSTGPPRIILGVTNPFFTKTLSHWPNLIKLGGLEKDKKGGSDTLSPDTGQSKGVLSSSPSSSSYRPSSSSTKSVRVMKASKNSAKVLDSRPGVYTNHKLYLEKDRTMVKRLLRAKEQRKPPEVLSSWIRKFFRELTESFSIPLEHYLSTLMPLAKTVSPWKESPQLKSFVAQDFLKHIERAGPQLTSGLKGDWVGLYRQFLSSHNFNCWLLSRKTEINQRLQLVHLDAISQANLSEWLDGRSEVEAVDLLIKLKEKLRRLSAGVPTRLQIDENVYKRIYEMMQVVVEKLPQDLKQSLLNNSLFATAHSLSGESSAEMSSEHS